MSDLSKKLKKVWDLTITTLNTIAGFIIYVTLLAGAFSSLVFMNLLLPELYYELGVGRMVKMAYVLIISFIVVLVWLIFLGYVRLLSHVKDIQDKRNEERDEKRKEILVNEIITNMKIRDMFREEEAKKRDDRRSRH